MADSIMLATYLLLLTVSLPCFCQRPFYAGTKPIGYPDIPSRPGTFRGVLPPELNGDVNYANRLDQMPVDQQPFWYINRGQYDDLRKNPKTYPHRPSIFNDN